MLPAEVICVDRVEKKFSKQNVLYEMEAYGFIKELENFVTENKFVSLK